jgi:hypothetical protein
MIGTRSPANCEAPPMAISAPPSTSGTSSEMPADSDVITATITTMPQITFVAGCYRRSIAGHDGE